MCIRDRKTGLPREKIGIIFLSPCPSKVTYVRSPLGTEKSEVDHVLAIKDVYPKLLSYMKGVGNESPDLVMSGRIGKMCIRDRDWDNGYMVVMAKYRHNQEPEEEYIDLVPILKNLYIDASQFLKPIKEVRLVYEQN